jgi:hypothetical protein
MKRILFSITIALLFCVVAGGQTPSDELTRIREAIGSNVNTKISIANDRSIHPSGNQIAVYIATGLDIVVHENFIRWIDEWNRSGDAKRYGPLRAVTSLSEADIIFVRYTLNDQARTESGSIPTVGTVWDPATNKIISRPTQTTFSRAMVPVFAYVLRRKEAEIEILSRYSTSTRLGEGKSSGRQLWDDFKKLLKATR